MKFILALALHKITCCSGPLSQLVAQLARKNEMQEMMVHETAQSCYLINRFSQLLKLERMESGGMESLLLAFYHFFRGKAQPEMKND